MKKGLLGLSLALLLLAAACGGSSEQNAATFGDDDDPTTTSVCQPVPLAVGGITVAGRRIEGVSNVKVCVDAVVGANVAPEIINQPECGDPCFTVEVADMDIAGDSKIVVTYDRDGTAATPIEIDPPSVNQGRATGRQCVLGYGTPDPCADRITTPKNLTATSGKKKVKLAWSGSTDTRGGPLAGYEIWRSDSGAEGTFVSHATTTETTYVDSGLVKGVAYYYYVVAFDTDGNHSLASNTATAAAK